MKKVTLSAALTLTLCVYATQGWANVDQLKFYRDENPDLKPNCMYCHIDKTPKKEKGKNELNPYGKEMKKLIDLEQTKGLSKDQLKAIYSNVFKKLGRHDQFKTDSESSGANNENPPENTK